MSKSRQLSDAINSVDISESAPADAVTLDSSGNLLVGKTAIGQGTAGFEARATGQTFCTDDGNTPFLVNRLTSDGELIQLNKDGTNAGSITTRGGDVLVGTGDTAVRFDDGGDAITPQNITTNTGRDAAIDLGVPSGRFKDLYLSGGVYLGGTGSANYLDDYEEGTWTPTDASGAGMTLTTTASQYTKIGDMVFVCAEVNFPSTSSTAHVKVGGLPFTATDNGAWAGVVRYTNSSEDPTITHVNNNNYMTWYEKSGGIFINTSVSGHRFDFILIYKAA